MVSPVKEISSAARSVQDTAEFDARRAARHRSPSLPRKSRRSPSAARARHAQTAVDTAEAGASELRRTIRRQPVVAMAAAAAAGAVLALLVVPRFGRPSSPASRWDSWTPNITRADLHDFADNISRSVSRAAHSGTASITPAFERLVDALSRVDTGSSMSSLVDKASGWFQKAQDKAKEKMG